MFVVFSTCGFLGRQRADQVSNRDCPSKEKKNHRTKRRAGLCRPRPCRWGFHAMTLVSEGKESGSDQKENKPELDLLGGVIGSRNIFGFSGDPVQVCFQGFGSAHAHAQPRSKQQTAQPASARSSSSSSPTVSPGRSVVARREPGAARKAAADARFPGSVRPMSSPEHQKSGQGCPTSKLPSQSSPPEFPLLPAVAFRYKYLLKIC
jgi:hypothetical protein